MNGVAIGFTALAFLWVYMASNFSEKQQELKLLFNGMGFINGVMASGVLAIISGNNDMGVSGPIYAVMGVLGIILFIFLGIMLIKIMENGVRNLGA